MVPDLRNLLELTDENDNSMRDLILKFQSEVEVKYNPLSWKLNPGGTDPDIRET